MYMRQQTYSMLAILQILSACLMYIVIWQCSVHFSMQVYMDQLWIDLSLSMLGNSRHNQQCQLFISGDPG